MEFYEIYEPIIKYGKKVRKFFGKLCSPPEPRRPKFKFVIPQYESAAFTAFVLKVDPNIKAGWEKKLSRILKRYCRGVQFQFSDRTVRVAAETVWDKVWFKLAKFGTVDMQHSQCSAFRFMPQKQQSAEEHYSKKGANDPPPSYSTVPPPPPPCYSDYGYANDNYGAPPQLSYYYPPPPPPQQMGYYPPGPPPPPQQLGYYTPGPPFY